MGREVCALRRHVSQTCERSRHAVQTLCKCKSAGAFSRAPPAHRRGRCHTCAIPRSSRGGMGVTRCAETRCMITQRSSTQCDYTNADRTERKLCRLARQVNHRMRLGKMCRLWGMLPDWITSNATRNSMPKSVQSLERVSRLGSRNDAHGWCVARQNLRETLKPLFRPVSRDRHLPPVSPVFGLRREIGYG
jgi:hypothetical protein